MIEYKVVNNTEVHKKDHNNEFIEVAARCNSNEVAEIIALHLNGLRTDDELYTPNDVENNNHMIKINGISFRCDCGANVFNKPYKDRPDKYECNGCGIRYTAT